MNNANIESMITGINFQSICNAVIDFDRKIALKDLIGNRNIDMLHLDIQGAEASVLKELCEDNLLQKIKYIFCSLHSTYDECIQILDDSGLNIEYIFLHPTAGGFGDGLIVCKL